ncbi:MAG TPA: GxxExxY protein [Rhizomicrobium sp.]|nr:GxxExxY protein [Rhizomicrobium sp.]
MGEIDRSLDDITDAIISASIQIHRTLGPGLLESVYEASLARTLERRGFRAARQISLPFDYEDMLFGDACRIDLLVEERIIVELKSVEKIAPVHGKQVLTYLRLLKLPLGLLINFGEPTLKQGIHRIVNGLAPSASPRLRVNQLG